MPGPDTASAAGAAAAEEVRHDHSEWALHTAAAAAVGAGVADIAPADAARTAEGQERHVASLAGASRAAADGVHQVAHACP